MVKKTLIKDLANEEVQAHETPVPNSANSRMIKNVTKDGKMEIDLNELRKANIFFATPCYGGMITDQYFLSTFRTSQELMKYGIPFRLTTLRNESLIPRARNILTAMFMESGCSHLMFIDADIEFEPESIIRMLSFDKDIVVGAYPKKTVNWAAVKEAAKRGDTDLEKFQADYAINFKFMDLERKQVRYEKGAIEVLDASTGFFMIKREVIEKMMDAYPERHYKNDSNIDPALNKWCYALFDTGIDELDSRYLSEDYFFCRLWQKLGGEVWLDPHTNLNHVGSYTFQGNVAKIFRSDR